MPESLVRNVYAYYGDRSSNLSSGLPHDSATARQFFDRSLRGAWSLSKTQPYDFFVQSPTWKLGAVSISILRKQFDKTYVAVAFDNNGRAVTLNFILATEKSLDHRLAQEREYAARSFGPRPAAAPSSRQVLIRSLKEGRGAGAKVWRSGASICGTTGGSILGGGSGGGGGGLNWDAPGGSICAEAASPKASAATTAQIRIDNRFMEDIS